MPARLLINTLLILGLWSLTGCLGESGEDEESSTVNTAYYACNHYVDNGTHSYFQCDDYADAEGVSEAAVEQICDALNSGEVSEGCGTSYTFGGATYPSSGSCSYTSDTDDMESRWYLVTTGDGLSETGHCSFRSGTFTED